MEHAHSQEEDIERVALKPPEEDLNNNSTTNDQHEFYGDGASSDNPSDYGDDDDMPLASFKVTERTQKCS